MTGVPYVFSSQTSPIPLAELDANFSTPITIGTSTVGLGNTITDLSNVGNVTCNNVTASGNISGTINSNGTFTAAAFIGGGISAVAQTGGTVSSGPNGPGGISYLSNNMGQPNDRSWEHFVGTAGGYTVIIYGNGDIINANNSYGAISDEKLKQDIAPAGSQWNDIKAIGSIIKKYRLKATPESALQLGVVAQDVQAISPGLVSADDDFEITSDENGNQVKKMTGTQTLGVKYSVLYMKAVKALAEALERIEALENRA